MLAHGLEHHGWEWIASMPAVAGLIAGVAHVVTGPDHLAAVAPLAVEQRRNPWLAGSIWGIGHSGSIWLLAVLALLFRETLPINAISAVAERLVGVVLIAIGLWGLRRVMALHVHTHTHTHVTHKRGTHQHTHTHVHASRPGEPHEHATESHAHPHSMLGIGALHGLAGTSHFVGVLPALGMPSRESALAYALAFGIGSIVGMGVFSGALGWLIQASDSSGRRLTKAMLSLSSVAAIGVGAWWCKMTIL